MRTTLLALALLWATPAAADPDSQVMAGVVAQQNGDHAAAIAKLDDALADPTQLRAKNLAKAYYHRARARIGLMQQAPVFGAELPADTLVRAVEDLLAARATGDGLYTARVENDLLMLRSSLLGVASQAIQLAQKPGEDDRVALFESAVAHLDLALRVDDGDYMAHDLRAQARFDLAGGVAATRETAGPAREDFQAAVRLYEARPPARADLLIGYACYRLALIERYAYADLDAALAWLAKGHALGDSAWKRLQADKERYTAREWEALEERYRALVQDLNAFELDVYLQSPDRREEALQRFARATAENPRDYVLWVAYGGLLELTDPDAALAAYTRAWELDPQRAHAPFNAGALFMNHSRALMTKANETDNPEEIEVLQAQALAAATEAVGWLEKALEVESEDRQTLHALKQGYLLLERDADYRRIKDLEASLDGG